jgi:hypothetical protein
MVAVATTKKGAAKRAPIVMPLLGVTSAVLNAALLALRAPGGIAIRDANAFQKLLTDAGAQPLFTPPVIGEYWPGQGGIYSGQVREEDGTTYHQIKATVKPAGRLNHGAAMKWAASLVIDGHNDFTLPTRRGSSLLFANLRHLFEAAYYWTCETYEGNASYAWYCYFGFGDTYASGKHGERQAVAVRRFKA